MIGGGTDGNLTPHLNNRLGKAICAAASGRNNKISNLQVAGSVNMKSLAKNKSSRVFIKHFDSSATGQFDRRDLH
jgi:hypothetical protein